MEIFSIRSSRRRAGKHYDIHVSDNVLAENIADAIAHVAKKRPDSKIWTAAHKGGIREEMISDSALRQISKRDSE